MINDYSIEVAVAPGGASSFICDGCGFESDYDGAVRCLETGDTFCNEFCARTWVNDNS